MTTLGTQYVGNQNHNYIYDSNERSFHTINGSNIYRNSYRSNYSTTRYNDSAGLSNGVSMANGDLMNGTVLRVNTMPVNVDNASFRASTLSPNRPLSPPVFHLVRKSSMYAPRVEVPSVSQLKVDIYSVGVIMEAKMTGAFDPDLFKVEAIAPTGRVIKITGDGQYAAQFNADEIGRWQVAMYYSGKYLDGCPIDVCDPSQVKVHDLKGGFVGKYNTFYVNCTKAGPGEVGVDITHNGRPVTTHITPTQTRAYNKVTFLPNDSGAYEINVHFNRAEVREGDAEFFNPDERQRKAVFVTRVHPHHGYIEVKSTCDWEVDYITGWPFICHITDASDISVYGMEDGTVCTYPEMIADCTHVGDGRIDAEVTYGRQRYSCKIKRDNKPGIYRVQFKPRGPGTYKVWINYEGRLVKGSPFIQEIAELEKPTANGDGLFRGVLGKPTSFIIDTRGFPSHLSVAVNGPSKPVNVQLEPQFNNTVKAVYYPIERGPHTINIRMDGRDIEGSPYRPLIVDPVSVRVSGGWRPLLDERGVIPLRVNKEKYLPFDVSDAGQGELTSEVQGPNGKIPVTIDARNDGKHSVIFTPREEGKHYIHVNWSGYPLSNSPYLGYATFEPELEEPYNVRLVHVPVQPHESRRPVATSSMVGSFVDGPHSNVQDFEPDYYLPAQMVYTPTDIIHRQPDHVYRPQEPVYRSQEFFSNSMEETLTKVQETYQHSAPTFDSVSTQTPDSSTKVQQVSPVGQKVEPEIPTGPQKVTLRGRGLKEAEVDKVARFTVDGTQANPGTPNAYLQGVNDSIPVTCDPVSPNVYKCTYVPKQRGAYLLRINWNDTTLKGSPFKVDVRDAIKPPAVIKAEPRHSIVGKELELKIDSVYSLPGILVVKCTDPLGKDVPCELKENHDGTRSVKLKPKIPGRHIVEILYNGNNVMGSPYAIDIRENNVSGPVRIWGPGIENGILPLFESTFWVDTTGAGSGEMRVRIMGPKGAFHVKVRKASQKDKIFQCFYDPVQPGIYTIIVQWSGKHVNGSPFTVFLANSAQELKTHEELLETSFMNGDDSSVITQKYSKNLSPLDVSVDDVILY